MKKIIALIMTICILAGCLSVSASAETNENMPSTAFLSVYYDLHGRYSINIPGSITISENEVVEISADYLLLNDTEVVSVYVDDSAFSSNGYFELQSLKDSSKMKCALFASSTESEEGREVTRDENTEPLISYTTNNGEAKAYLQFTPQVSRDNTSGMYEGQIMFNIICQDTNQHN